jgi:hypothetical protein
MRNSAAIHHFGRLLTLPALAALIIFCISISGSANAAELELAVASTSQQEHLEMMKKKGVDASLTILPVRLAGQPFDRLTEVVGLMLEQMGLKNIELGKSVFNPEPGATLEILANTVSEFVKKNPVATDYALYSEFNGNRQTGLTELRAIVVDKGSAVVWMWRQSAEDEAFKKLGSPEPMSLSVLLVEQLGMQLGLSEETAKTAKPGKMARIMDERSGLPPQEERAPIEARQKEFKNAASTANLLIIPARVHGKATEVTSATDLAVLINKTGLCKASAAGQSIALESSQRDPNEMKVLWDFARESRENARKNPIDADYALFADYVFNPQNWEQGYVHFVVVDRKGEWVIVDLQNSHHPDYQNVKPVSQTDCDKILVKRLEHYVH